MTKETTDLQAKVESLTAALGRAGLLPAEVKKPQPLTDEEHKAISDEIASMKTARQAVVEEIEGRIAEAQERWQAARLLVNRAHDEMETLRAEITRGHEAHLAALGELTRKLAGGR